MKIYPNFPPFKVTLIFVLSMVYNMYQFLYHQIRLYTRYVLFKSLSLNMVDTKKKRKEELLNFGHSSNDDTVDSMVLTMGGLLRRGALQLEYNDRSMEL